MKELWLKITLEDDAVFSARTASLGLHECLDHIPGSALLGAVAALLYKEFKNRGEEWTVFHSGKVRFGCGRPWADAEVAWPLPLSWHFAKGHSIVRERELLAASLTNLAGGPWTEPAQPVQVRSGWFTASGRLVQIEPVYRMKSAIDPEKFDRAADEQLFGYSSLARGSSWLAQIAADDDVDAGCWEQIRNQFSAEKTIRLGRSKRSEYGRATCVVADEARVPKPPTAEFSSRYARFFAVSDLALLDEDGQSTLTPKPTHFELGDSWRLDPEKTFVRTRRYSPYNHYRNAFDLERQVVSKGSVITFVRDETSVPPAEMSKKVADRLARGVGTCLQDGLGEMLLNPPWLMSPRVAFGTASVSGAIANSGENARAAQPSELPSRPAYGFVKALGRRFEQHQLALAAEQLGARWADRWAVRGGPSKSQWGRVRELAVNAAPKDGRTERDSLLEGLRDVFKREKWTRRYRSLESESLGQDIEHCLTNTAALTRELTDLGISPARATRLEYALAVAACRESALEVVRRSKLNP